MASNSSSVTVTLPTAYLYYLYAALLLADVVLAFVAKVLPSSYGVAGLGVLAVAFSGSVAHDFEDAHAPANVPTWATYLVVVVAGAVVTGAGSLTSNTPLTLAGAIALVVVILGAVYHSVAEDAGASAPAYIETYALAATGIALSVLTWYAQNPTATAVAIITTVITTAVNYVHVTGSSVTVSLPTPAATP